VVHVNAFCSHNFHLVVRVRRLKNFTFKNPYANTVKSGDENLNAEKEIVVRKATHKDIGGIIEVLKSTKLDAEAWTGDERWARKALEECLTLENFVFLVAEYNKRIVGFVDCCVYPSFWEGAYQGIINHLFVHSAFQGKGAGAVLIEAVVKETDAKGLGELHVSTERENVKARRLYAKYGFTEERLLLERAGSERSSFKARAR
jgi:ribosomal protein S18 acetylase RimI-like enzyme